MKRYARLGVFGTLNHIIARCIERSSIPTAAELGKQFLLKRMS